METSERNTIIKWTGIVAILGVISKILGFFREAAIAYIFGASLQTDAYFMSLTIPFILFGAFSSAIRNVFIPVYGSRRGKEGISAFVSTFTLILTAFLLALTVLVLLFTPFLVRIFAPGFTGEVFDLTVRLTRITAPALVFMGLAGLTGGFLNAHHSFLGPALAGVPYNLTIIFSALVFGTFFGIKGLAVGTVFAYAAQLFINMPWLLKHRFSVKRPLDLHHEGLKEVLTLMPPVLLASASAELKAMLDRLFASLLQRGVLSSMNYATRIRSLPGSIFATALITVLYPTLIDAGAKAGLKEYKESLRQGIGIIVFILFPITVALLTLTEPVVRLIYKRGAFDEPAVALTTAILFFYAFGVTGESLIIFLQRAFFALKDSKTPMLMSLTTTALNGLLNYLLMGPFEHRGIALATTISFWVSTTFLLYFLRRKIGPMGGKKLMTGVLKMLMASGAMTAAILGGLQGWTRFLPEPQGFLTLSLQVGSLSALGFAVYLLAVYLFRVEEMHYFIILLRKIKRRSK